MRSVDRSSSGSRRVVDPAGIRREGLEASWRTDRSDFQTRHADKAWALQGRAAWFESRGRFDAAEHFRHRAAYHTMVSVGNPDAMPELPRPTPKAPTNPRAHLLVAAAKQAEDEGDTEQAERLWRELRMLR